jgi:hypothetical protein
MADEQSDLFKEFEEFIAAKRQAEKDEQSAEDFEIEIWDEKGRGVRTRRSHAKPFLNSLGIDIDAPADNDSEDESKSGGKTNSKGGGKPRGPSSNATGTQSTVRKYFTKNPVK